MLTCDDLQLSFGDTVILNGVSFSIKPGETVGLIGPNGSGKTSLFNCISGFNFPDAGTIIYKNTEITEYSPAQRAHQGLGRVFQNFGIFKEMSVRENIITALESRTSIWRTLFPWGSSHSTNSETSTKILEQIGLDKKAKHKAGSLSGGQLRLLEIARTLAFGADLFLLDEPTAGVSPKMKTEVAALIAQLKNSGRTVLIIEHDLNFIESFCDRILVLDSGKIALDGSLNEVRKNPLLQEIYFGKS